MASWNYFPKPGHQRAPSLMPSPGYHQPKYQPTLCNDTMENHPMNLSPLMCRIAVLETELKQQREELAAAQKVNLYLVQQLQGKSEMAARIDVKLAHNLSRTALENRALRDKLRQKRKLQSYAGQPRQTAAAKLDSHQGPDHQTEHPLFQRGHTHVSTTVSIPSLSPFAPVYTPSDCSFSTSSTWNSAIGSNVHAPVMQSPAGRSTLPLMLADGSNYQGEEKTREKPINAGPCGDLDRSIWALPKDLTCPPEPQCWPPTTLHPDHRSTNFSPADLRDEGLAPSTSVASSSKTLEATNAIYAAEDRHEHRVSPQSDEDLLQFPEEKTDVLSSSSFASAGTVHAEKAEQVISRPALKISVDVTPRNMTDSIRDSRWATPQDVHPSHGRVRRRAALASMKATKSLQKPASSLHDSENSLALGSPEDIALTRSMLMYQPKEGQSDLYRTILATDISPTIPVASLMSCVRGGLVVSARPMNTATFIGHHSLMITFLKEQSARDFIRYAKTHTLRLKVGDKQITLGPGSIHTTTFSLLRSATWPIGSEVLQRIESSKHTRCLAIHGLDEEITMIALCNVLSEAGTKHHAVLSAGRDSLGSVHLEFASIAAAERAVERLANHPWARGTDVEFTEDPCSQPLPADAA